MKKNFLVTTGLVDTWEFNETNFLLGKWCELYEFSDFNKNQFVEKIPTKIAFERNIHHWEDNKKKDDDLKYLEEKLDYLLEVLSNKLSLVHNIEKDKEYWRIIIFSWLITYVSTMFDRWEVVRIFFEKNKDKKFYSYSLSINDLKYLSKDHKHFMDITQEHEWNHLVFLRIFSFLKLRNLSLIGKQRMEKDSKKNNLYSFDEIRSAIPLHIRILKFIDNVIAKIAFKFNRIVFESFHFPKIEYLKICLRCKLIPSKESDFFSFKINNKNITNEDGKRNKLKDSLLSINTEDKFINFLISNLHKDMPKSYLENFNIIKNAVTPFAKENKIIFSMHRFYFFDGFKTYIAEAKKNGSRCILADHGAGFPLKVERVLNYPEKIADKIITWDNTKQDENLFVHLSPTIPIIKLKNNKRGNDCSIIFCEMDKYINHYNSSPNLNQSMNTLNEIIKFVKKLNPEVQSKIKFRSKGNYSFNSDKKFSKIFGENALSKISYKNTIQKTILNSKLIISTYPQTAFAQVMYSNVPTILIIKKGHWEFTKTGTDIFENLKKEKIAFENFDQANIHVNKYWNEIDSWWNTEKVQSARQKFLVSFFHVKQNWYKEWSDYMYFSKKL